MFNEHKNRNGLVSLFKTMACSTLIAACLASESQAPLNFNAVSKLKWEGCGELNNHTLECSRLDVPMDHFSKSSNKTFSIPVVRMLGKNVTGDNHILLNPGGPGGSGVDFLKRGGEKINKIVGEGFHLLSFDPRGVGGSIPQAICYLSDAQRAQSFANTPWDLEFEAGEMYTKAENKAKACQDTMGEYGLYVNTPQTASDMNSILDAIVQEKMYYWGFSYGTTLGQTYAQMFPERVHRLIIDGVTNLDEWYNSFYFQESLSDTDRIFFGFVDECFKAKDACPMNSIKGQSFKSSADLKSYIDDFLKNLEEEPIPVYVNNTNYGSVTRRKLAANGIFSSLYRPSPAWPFLAEALASLLNGNNTPAYNAYSDNWVAAVLGDETNTFVVANDNLKSGAMAPAHGIKQIQNYSMARPVVSNLVSKYDGSDLFEWAAWSIPTTHTFRPQYHPEFPRFKTAEPILVLSTTWDPVCPLVSAKKAHNSFEGAGLVEQKSYGHCSISMPSLCTAKHVHRYFNDGVLPEAGAKCDIDAEYFPAKGKSSVSTLSAEDEELLTALRDLANEDLISPMGPGGRVGV
ncbi:putative hydrolase [Lachnellula suecica]|uniref:Putative hydrolase n=1 Tax=Lachnellula suecica TaxID=602035 RepID=A0A8T9C6K5_9HELO|nr:putative hydrolase [Lachnellula suecica]